MREIWAKVSYWWFITILIIVGLFTGDIKVKADELTAWNSVQIRMEQDDHGTSTWTSYQNVSGTNLTFTPTLPVKSIQWRLTASQKLSRENTYTLDFSYKPTPDSISVSSYYISRGGLSEKEGLTCTQYVSDTGLYHYKCTFTPYNDLASGSYLYVRIIFNQEYLTSLLTRIIGYEERKGTNAIITEQTNNIINSFTTDITNLQNALEQSNAELKQELQGLKEQQSEEQQVCQYIDKTNIVIDNSYLNGPNVTGNYNDAGITDYINIKGGKIQLVNFVNYYASWCFYDVNKSVISCANVNSVQENQYLPIPNNAQYFRSTIYKSINKPTFNICKNGNQAINDYLKDDTIDSPNDMIEDFEDMLPTNGTITNLIALPITLYTKILNSINGTCSSWNLGSLYGTNLIIPCIEVSNYLGSTLWGTIDLIMSGVFILIISKKMIKAFEGFTSMKEGDVIND